MDHVGSFFNVPKGMIARIYDEASSLPEYRTEFMRDRDRLMYATAFRRLSGKTQIYTVGRDDHRKNRLTHTLEVAQIARTIASALGFDSDLAEAIALGHDFGHTPFGHAGEKMLDDIMMPNSKYIKNSPFHKHSKEELRKRFEREKTCDDMLEYAFGFKHNLQSVRVATTLEDSYCDANNRNIGLNLTNFTLYGMLIHSSEKYSDNDCPNFQHQFDQQMKLKGSNEFAWSFEADIVRWADDIAQWHHDFEDAMREEVLPLDDICEKIQESLNDALDETDREKLQTYQQPAKGELEEKSEEKVHSYKKNWRMDRRCIAELSHIVVNTLVNDLIESSNKNLNDLKTFLLNKGIEDSEQVFTGFASLQYGLHRNEIIGLSDKIKYSVFKDTIKECIHHSRNVQRMNEKGKYIIRKLFEAYYSHPQQLPDGPILHLLVDIGRYPNIDKAKKAGIGKARVDFENKIKNPSAQIECLLMRRICDHIASMTDHYAVEEYNNLYG